jgi:hypothetical protein
VTHSNPATTRPCRASLPPERFAELAAALGDSPETAMDLTQLALGRCRAYVAGSLPRFDAAVVQVDDNPTEVNGYGSDPEALDGLLQIVPGWACVLVSRQLEQPLSALLERRLGLPLRHYGDVAYVAPQQGLVRHVHPDVRLLTLEDLPLLQAEPRLQGKCFGSPEALLRQGVAAGAVVQGALVAMTHTSGLSPRYGEIGAYCLEPYRRRGYVTAAAWLVAERLRAMGRTPIWSTGETNWASQRVAEKLGFVRQGGRVYLIPQRPTP